MSAAVCPCVPYSGATAAADDVTAGSGMVTAAHPAL